MSVLLVALLAVPLVGGIALIVVRPPRGAVPAGLLIAAATVGLAVAAARQRPVGVVPLLDGIAAGFAVDDLSAVMIVLVAVALLAVLAFAAGEPALRSGRFVGLVLVFAGAMLATVTATTLPPLLAAWEVMGATSWALIAHHTGDPAAARGARTAFLTTRTADLGLYLAAGAILAGGVPTLAIDALPVVAGGWRDLAVAGVVVAAVGKSAQLPFSFWLAGAMHGPSPVSALLHSATMVAAGAYLLLRTAAGLDATDWAGPLVAWVGVATALLLGLVALAQSDLKQLLAASTSAQIGYMVLAAGVGAVPGGVLQTVAHGATKSLLFLVAGAWLVRVGSRELDDLRGAARRHPVLGVSFTVGAVALAGVPPTGLWVSKDAVLAGAAASSPALYAVGLAAGLVSAGYATKALWFVWRPSPPATEDAAIGRAGARLQAAVAVTLAVTAAAAGLLALGPDILRPAPEPTVLELVVSGAIALVGVGVTWRAAGRFPAPAALRAWLGLERLAVAVSVRPALRLATALARLDDRFHHRVVLGAGRAAVRAADVVDRRVERGLDRGVDGVAAGARALGRTARRPQTGQLHQYYAQAAVGFGVLAALAVILIGVS
ncbi:proton-conducting transporter membrane subunit [Actinomycetospora straminea]|uniref:NADH:quinone oxidoreductase/Mrp antiporter transmembrane domain-containing protein n=1 Tax=Actinomycetospora straminea TaxID=663607 RepID=A0ABP9E0C9_9PSEU|nr:proton-conducting transporter membrane subunit [Actinomycetospora straminea]MDD7934203.1 proton-conducting transporter membrane subunit [Actinomycetospora straminea]